MLLLLRHHLVMRRLHVTAGLKMILLLVLLLPFQRFAPSRLVFVIGMLIFML